MLDYLAITLIISSVFLYAVLLMIECGATIFAVAPELLGGNSDGSREGGMLSAYIGPVWETTNVFLVFSFVSLMAFFPDALPVWGHALVVPFFVFLAVMGVRAIGMLFVFYHKNTGRFMKVMLVCAALAVPVVFATGIIPYFLTGATISGLGGWLLAFYLGGFTFASTLLISFSFFEYLAARRGIRVAPALDFFTTFFALVFVMVSIFLFLTMPFIVPHIAPHFVVAIPFFAGLSILEFILMMPPYKKYKGRKAALAIALFAVVFFGIAFAQLPYLIYPTITIAGAFTDVATARAMFLVLGAGAMVTIPALFLLYYLFAYKNGDSLRKN